nr:LysR family transcriptional regulator [uncultured Carboxylicivirga sp.]
MKSPFTITNHIEIYKFDQLFVNQKRIHLLCLVRDRGSINAASKEMKMSYQQAWHFIKEMNELSPLPLVIRQRGGSNGGGAVVTKFGLKVIARFEMIVNEINICEQKMKEQLQDAFF